MKRLVLTLVLAAALSGGGFAEMRKWTSTDETLKTFEGELTAAKGGNVTIKKKTGRTVTVPLATLSQEDRDFVAAAVKAKVEATVRAAAVAILKTGEVAKALSDTTVKFDGKKVRKYDIFSQKAPEHYLLFWGGAWSSPCQLEASQLAGIYDESISKGRNIEVVFLSFDKDESAMNAFMREMKFNFPGVPLARWEKKKIFQDMTPARLPDYRLLDPSGKVIAEGEEAKAKAKELAGGGAHSAAQD